MKRKGWLFAAITLLSLLSLRSKAQIDTIFWFAVPEVTASHADNPIYLRLSADNKPSAVKVTIPSTGTQVANVVVTYGVSSTVNLTPFINQLENVTPNVVQNRGLLIEATEPITAYYELAPNINTEIMTLKGGNGLGTKFICPFQTRYVNDPGFNGECWSSIDIVASENNTTVNINPFTDVIGHKKNIPYSITLNRGQTYSIRDSLKTKNTGNLSGTLVTSDKKISVTLKDDGVQVPNIPQGGTDFVGDQLMAFENVGKQYIAIRGELGTRDYLYVVGTANGTNLSVNGVASVINDRQTVEFSITSNIYISADQPVYVYHLTGSQNESGSAILPSIECTGSSSIAFTRANANKSVLLISVPTIATGNFLLNNNAASIPASAFTAVPGSPGWSAAKIDLSGPLIIGSNTVRNTRSLFHMALVNGDNGSGGSAYGYFSNYKAEISAGKDSTICAGSQIALPDPGVYYSYQYTVLSGDMNSLTQPNIVKPNQTSRYILQRLGSCPTSDTVTVFINDLKANAGLDTTLCQGKARVGGNPAATGGVTPYTYSWNSGETADSAIVGVGSYRLTVTDKMGCKNTDTVEVKLGSGTTLTPGHLKPSCFGVSDGKAFLQSIVGGAAPFTYKWQTGATSDTITVGAGSYKVVVTDRYGCTDSVVVVVTQPARLDIDTVVTHASCPLVQNGKVVCSATGGTSSYQYSVNTGSFGTSGTFSPLTAGNYLFKVKDSKGCLDSANVTIKVGNPPVVTAPNDTAVCPGSSLTFSGASTTTGLTYTWTGGITDGVPFSATKNFTYTVTGKDAAGCSGTDATTVTLNPVPNPKIGNTPSVICSDTSNIQLTSATPGGIWGGTGVNANTGVFSPTTAGPGTWQITYIANTGCSDTDTVYLTVTKRMDAFIDPAGPFCTTASIQQLTTHQSNGIWSGTGVNSDGEFNPAAAGSGNHVISYSMAGTCPDKQSITIQVSSSFDPSIIPSGPFCASDAPVQLQSVTPGVTWTGTAVTALGIFDPHAAGPGTHTITHTIGGGCGGTDTEQYTVLPLDTAHIILQNDSMCYNSPAVQLNADKNGGTWSGACNSSGVFDPNGMNPGSYKVYYTYVQRCAYTDSAELIITDTLTATLGDDTVSCFGATDGTLSTVVVNGSSPLYYSWSDNASAITANRTGLGIGSYTLTVTDALGCADNATATITQPSVLAFVSVTPIDDSCYHANKGSVVFVNSGGTAINFTTPYTYTLSPVAGTVNQNGNGFRSLGAGNYTVTASDKNGCTATSSFTINEPAALQVFVSNSPDYCGQLIGSCQVDSTKGGTGSYSHEWTNGPSGTSWTNRGSGSYMVTATDQYGCTVSNMTTVQNIAGPTQTVVVDSVSCYGYNDGRTTTTVSGGTGALHFSWSDAAALDVSQRNDLKAGTYWVKVTDAKNCVQQEPFEIKEPKKLKMDPVQGTLLCYGIPFTGTFNAQFGNSGNRNFFLNFASQAAAYSLNTAGTYRVYATDSKGCYSDTITFKLDRNPDITASLSPDPTVCRFDTARFSCSASNGNGTYQYKWDNLAASANASKQYITGSTTPAVSPVTVVVTDGCSKPDTVNGNYFLFTDPTVSVSATPVSGCYPLTVNFTVSGNLDQFEIKSDDGTLLGISTNFSYIFQDPGIFHPVLDGATVDGCQSHYTAIGPITVHDYPLASYYWLPEEPSTVDNQLQLKNTSDGGSNTYKWTGLDTNNVDTIFASSQTNPVWTMPNEAGEYDLELVAISQFGCTDTLVQTIKVSEVVTVYLANTFSPNDDGYNEVYYPVIGIDNISAYNFQVFDRWGERVFMSTDRTKGWDGTFNGTPCKVDVYPFRLTFTPGGTTQKKLIVGHISLIR